MFHPTSLAIGRHPNGGADADRDATAFLTGNGFTHCPRLRAWIPPAHLPPGHQHARITAAVAELSARGFPLAHIHHATTPARPANCCPGPGRESS